MRKTLTLGFSPCPNDTFIFAGLVQGQVPVPGFTLAPPRLLDVETLNRMALAGDLDVTKLSFHALGHVLDRYALLRSGAALGRGCGPLLVSREPLSASALAGRRIAVPGRLTTAAMLLRLFLPGLPAPEVLRFDRIIPALDAGTIDAGVIIHESRFLYDRHGLHLVQDLGAWWESETGLPIPLGGIAARRDLGSAAHAAIETAIAESLRWARGNEAAWSSYVRSHAQELDAAVIRQHIDLYVNDFSLDLGVEGERAIAEFLRRGHSAGLFPTVSPDGIFA